MVGHMTVATISQNHLREMWRKLPGYPSPSWLGPLWVALLLHLAKSTPWNTRVFFRPWVDRQRWWQQRKFVFYWIVWCDLFDLIGTKKVQKMMRITQKYWDSFPGNWKCAIIMIDSGYLIQFPGNWWFVGDNWIKPTKNISHKNMCRKMMGPQAWFWVP